MARCLVVLNPGAEEIETITVADILVRAGVEVTVARSAETGGELIRGSRMLPLCADTVLSACDVSSFDVVYIPGGIGSAEYARDNEAVQSLITNQLASPRLLTMICAAPISLVPQGLAQGKRLTCYPGLKETLQQAGAEWLDQRVVADGNLITSQGPGTAMDLGLYLAARLTDDETAQKVADAMLVSWTP